MRKPELKPCDHRIQASFIEGDIWNLFIPWCQLINKRCVGNECPFVKEGGEG